MNTEAEKPEAMVARITAFIHEAHEHVAQGHAVDLAGLDVKVKELCDHLVTLPQEEAVQYSAALQGLSDELTVLRDRLQDAQAGVRGQLETLNAREKAAKAYTKTEAAEKTVTPPRHPKDQE